MFFINKMDDENANFWGAGSIDNLWENVVAFEIPIVEGGQFIGYVNIVTLKAYKFER